jgi:hypothetical protein
MYAGPKTTLHFYILREREFWAEGTSGKEIEYIDYIDASLTAILRDTSFCYLVSSGLTRSSKTGKEKSLLSTSVFFVM